MKLVFLFGLSTCDEVNMKCVWLDFFDVLFNLKPSDLCSFPLLIKESVLVVHEKMW